MQKIAFIGLGHMGLPMARNLLKAGYALRVFDLVRSAVDQLAGEGAQAADSARDAVQDAEVVISMLPASVLPSWLPATRARSRFVAPAA